MAHTTIIGAGICGLTAAWNLKKTGHEVLILEKSNRVGGLLHTVHDQNFTVEMGATSLRVHSQKLWDFLLSIGLKNKILPILPTAQKRFILRENKLYNLPSNFRSFFTSDLFSFKTKLRILAELFQSKQKNLENLSVADFIVHRFGREVLDYVINPMVAGIYAGDASALSLRYAFPKLYQLAKEHGSLLKGILFLKKDPDAIPTRIISFENGMADLVNTLWNPLQDLTQFGVEDIAIEKIADQWSIQYTSNGVRETVFTDNIIFALPQHAFKSLKIEIPGLKHAMEHLYPVEYTPVTSVSLAYRKKDVEHPCNGFGFLVPSIERLPILGTLFISSAFYGRAPKCCHLLTTYLGGALQEERCKENDDSIFKVVEDSLRPILRIHNKPVWRHVVRAQHAIPQYNRGYDRCLEQLHAIEKNYPGLYFLGNYREGIALSQCMLNALRLTQSINTPCYEKKSCIID